MPSPLDDLLDTVRTLTHQSSETVEPWHSYWHHRPTRDFPPKAIRDVEEYTGGERLSLRITQTDLPAKAQKALGKKFNIREFHDAGLLSGMTPLTVLEQVIDNYIVAKGGKA